jgi:hypothetical protein
MQQETLEELQKIEEIPVEEQIHIDKVEEVDIDKTEEFPTETLKNTTVEKEELVEEHHSKNMNEDENEKIVHIITEKEPPKDAPTKFLFKKIGFVLNPAAGKGRAGKDFGRYVFQIKTKNPLSKDLQTRHC